MAEFRPLVVGFLLFGLFAIALINFGLMVANYNNPSQSIGNDPTLSQYASDLNASLAEAHSDATSASSAIENSSITLTSGFPVFDAISGVWKTMKRVPIQIYNLTVGLLVSRMGTAFWVVFGIIGAILTITIIVAVYKMISQGEGG